MSDLVGNPEDRFCHNEAHLIQDDNAHTVCGDSPFNHVLSDLEG